MPLKRIPNEALHARPCVHAPTCALRKSLATVPAHAPLRRECKPAMPTAMPSRLSGGHVHPQTRTTCCRDFRTDVRISQDDVSAADVRLRHRSAFAHPFLHQRRTSKHPHRCQLDHRYGNLPHLPRPSILHPPKYQTSRRRVFACSRSATRFEHLAHPFRLTLPTTYHHERAHNGAHHRM